MVSIPLINIVHPQSKFVDAYNELVAQKHPLPLAYKFLEMSEVVEEEQRKYKILYDKKVQECLIASDNEIKLDPEKQKVASEEMTKFCRETTVEFPSLTMAEISHVTIEPERLRLLVQLGFVEK